MQTSKSILLTSTLYLVRSSSGMTILTWRFAFIDFVLSSTLHAASFWSVKLLSIIVFQIFSRILSDVDVKIPKLGVLFLYSEYIAFKHSGSLSNLNFR